MTLGIAFLLAVAIVILSIALALYAHTIRDADRRYGDLLRASHRTDIDLQKLDRAYTKLAMEHRLLREQHAAPPLPPLPGEAPPLEDLYGKEAS